MTQKKNFNMFVTFLRHYCEGNRYDDDFCTEIPQMNISFLRGTALIKNRSQHMKNKGNFLGLSFFKIISKRFVPAFINPVKILF